MADVCGVVGRIVADAMVHMQHDGLEVVFGLKFGHQHEQGRGIGSA